MLLFSNTRASAADTLNWNTNNNIVSADIQSVPVSRLLAGIAKHTGWEIFLEPHVTHTVSTKFADLSAGEALRMLLGDLNFAMVPQTNGPLHLYVFRTSRRSATQLIRPEDLVSKTAKSGKIPNELVVTLKPGTSIDGLPCIKDATVTGRLNALNTYRVQFKDEAAANAGRDCLTANPNVLAVENNYSMEPPNVPLGVANASPQFNLTPKSPNDSSCQVVIGLIDTSVGTLGNNLDQLMLPSISVAGKATSGSQLTHGTAMADTIWRAVQANTSGQTSAKMMSVDVYGPNETTSTYDVATGIYDAVQAGANVINLSLGGQGDSTFLHTLIQNASKQGVVFFAAAGNQPVTTPEYPAAYPEVESVTAGSGPGQVADYANRGSFVDLLLPGTSIVPYDGQSWAVTGTSTSTAYATGIAAGLADAGGKCPTQVIPTMQGKFPADLSGGQP
ncbi:MAG TPA: S8 family serine peptidase [Candidatus Angelobacter sp.]|nr:S8 family serine peptidase [Candidatus Angelobacter sp.]